jgi:hypothetical protein
LDKGEPVACRDCVFDHVGHGIDDQAHGKVRMGPLRQFRFIVIAPIFTSLGGAIALAEMKVPAQDTRFCPSWAEAHERTLASLNNGRPPFPVKWKGCIVLKRGTRVDIVDQQEGSTEIVVRGRHWFADK